MRGGWWGGLVSALTAPRAGGVDQALVPGGGQGLNCNPEGHFHQQDQLLALAAPLKLSLRSSEQLQGLSHKGRRQTAPADLSPGNNRTAVANTARAVPPGVIPFL